MPSRPIRSVLIGAHSQYRGLLNAVARYFKEHYGAAVHLYCASKQQRNFYESRSGAYFDTVTVDNALYEGCREAVADAEAAFAKARRNEADLATTYNVLAMSNRHLGRGYALAGFKHPRSYISYRTSYPQLVAGFNRAIDFWRGEIADKRADLILNGGKVAAAVARAEGVPYRTIAGSRYRNLHYWAVNEYLENPVIDAAYRNLTEASDLQISKPYDTHLEMRSVLARNYTLVGIAKIMARVLAQEAYWRARGYDKARSYFLRDDLL